MPMKVRCTNCGQGYSVPEMAAGKTVTCKKCAAQFVIDPPTDDEIKLAPVTPTVMSPRHVEPGRTGETDTDTEDVVEARYQAIATQGAAARCPRCGSRLFFLLLNDSARGRGAAMGYGGFAEEAVCLRCDERECIVAGCHERATHGYRHSYIVSHSEEGGRAFDPSELCNPEWKYNYTRRGDSLTETLVARNDVLVCDQHHQVIDNYRRQWERNDRTAVAGCLFPTIAWVVIALLPTMGLNGGNFGPLGGAAWVAVGVGIAIVIGVKLRRPKKPDLRKKSDYVTIFKNAMGDRDFDAHEPRRASAAGERLGR